MKVIVALFVLVSVASLGWASNEHPKLHRVRLQPIATNEEAAQPEKVQRILHETQKCDALCETVYEKTDEHHSVCVRGCHYFILGWQASNQTDSNLKLNKSNLACHDSCKKGYSKPEEVSHCDTGCGRGAKHILETIPKEEPKMSTTSATPSNEPEDSTGQMANDPTRVMFERMVNMMLRFRERSREMMSQVRTDLPPLPLVGSGSEDVEKQGEAEKTDVTKPRAWPFSISRSLSIMVTTDKDGNRRIIVLNRPPQVTFGSPMGENSEEDKDELGNKDDRLLSSLQEEHLKALNNNNQKLGEVNDLMDNYKMEASGWSANMVDFTARSIFVVMLIMTLYLVFIVLLALRHRREQMLRRTPSMAATLSSSLPFDRPPPKYQAQNKEGNLKKVLKGIPFYAPRVQRPPAYEQVNSKTQAGLLPTMGKDEEGMP